MKRGLLNILVLASVLLYSCDKPDPEPSEAPEKSRSILSVMSFNVRYLAGDTGVHSWTNRQKGIYEMLTEHRHRRSLISYSIAG